MITARAKSIVTLRTPASAPAAIHGFIRPGFDISDDRPCDWNFETGISAIGF